MVYSSFAAYSKKAAHWAVDSTFPSTASIAATTAAASWYSYQVGMTYSQTPLTHFVVSQMGYSGYATAPLIVPWLSPIVSSYFSVGVSCLTSLTLNLIAKEIFNIDKTKETENQKIPLKMTPNHLLNQHLLNFTSTTTSTSSDTKLKANRTFSFNSNLRP